MSETAQAPSRVVPAPRLRVPSWLAWTLVLLVSANAIYAGIELRRWAWDQTTTVRFVNSVSNAVEWGNYARQIGVLEVYDDLFARFGPERDYDGPGRFALDYPPLRLLIVYWWTDWAYAHFPPPEGQPLTWQPEYEFTRPMLRLNLACELAAAVGMFLLVYRWMRICALPAPARWWTLRPSRGWGRTEDLGQLRSLRSTVGLRAATCAALLLWFNPAVIFNAHVYPQWDVWLLPPLIWAVFFGLMNWWLPAGIAVGICAMTKGQILLALPLLIAWPLLLGNLAAALRLSVGVAAGVGMVVWPWLTRAEATHLWMLHIAVGAVLVTAVGLLPRSKLAWIVLRTILGLVAVLVICSPVLSPRPDNWFLVAVLALVVVVIVMIGSRWWLPTSLAMLWAGSLGLTVPIFHASMAWYEIGTKYGTRHWRYLFWCLAPNLGSILQGRFDWAYTDAVDMSWVPGIGLYQMSTPWFREGMLNRLGQIPIREIMIWLYAIALIICIVGIVRHRRNHDPRLLVAIAAPLLMSYSLLPQMIERYMIWPAALLSAYAAINFGGLLLWFSLSAIACLMMWGYMLTLVRPTEVAQEWLPTIFRVFPDIGWAVLVLAGVVLYLAFTSSRRTTYATESLPVALPQ